MQFEWPYLLWALALVPILIGLYVLAQRRRQAYAVRFTNLALLQTVAGRGPGIRRHIPPFLFLLELAALLVGLARPIAVIATPREQAAVMLVVDVSGSMAATDIQPSRMEAAREAARAFVRALPPEVQVGVVGFSQQAALRAPLSTDRELILRAIDNLRQGGGTAIGDGLDAALEHLATRPSMDGQQPPARVVLLSDGESQFGAAPSAAAERAAAADIPVATVGVGQRGAAATIGSGQEVRLDETTLRAIAERTGGQYFYAAAASELEKIYADLGSQRAWVEERTEVTAIAAALGAALLITGMLLGLRWFQRFP